MWGLLVISVCAISATTAKELKYSPQLNLQAEALSEERISSVNSDPHSTWKAGRNAYFEGRKLSDAKVLMGVKRIPGTKRLPELVHVVPNDIPTEFDARTKWPNCPSIALVRDQSTCGSCWAFGAVEAMSDRICIASAGKVLVNVSATDLVSCCESCGAGCNGGEPSAAWSYWVHTGLVSGGLYGDMDTCEPYPLKPCDHHVSGKLPNCSGDSPTPKCTKQCVSQYKTPYTQDKHFGVKAYSISNKVEQIQTEIMTNGPVEVDFEVYEDFLAYKSGVYQHTSGGFLGGHAVKMLGWGELNGVPYWLCMNSWNTDWGDQGTFKILRGKDECGIEGDVNAGLPK